MNDIQERKKKRTRRIHSHHNLEEVTNNHPIVLVELRHFTLYNTRRRLIHLINYNNYTRIRS